MKQLEHATIQSHNPICPNTYVMVLKAPQIATHAKPGQFVMVHLNDGELLLPRPISLCDIDRINGIITLIYATAGAGTQVMSRWQAGRTVPILGPLGNGFDTDSLPKNTDETVALVGGGVGAPPLLFLYKRLTQAGIKADVYLGFKGTDPLADYFKPFMPSLSIATNDGSMGYKGTVIDLLKTASAGAIFSCGPMPMLKALAAYANATGIPCQISVEERMACGLGACKGCVVKTLVGYQLCCLNGPVFDSSLIAAQEDAPLPGNASREVI